MVSVIFYISHLWFYDVKMLLQKRKVCASPPRLDNILLKDWCKSLWVTISHCLPITSAEIDFIRCPILESRMNPPCHWVRRWRQGGSVDHRTPGSGTAFQFHQQQFDGVPPCLRWFFHAVHRRYGTRTRKSAAGNRQGTPGRCTQSPASWRRPEFRDWLYPGSKSENCSGIDFSVSVAEVGNAGSKSLRITRNPLLSELRISWSHHHQQWQGLPSLPARIPEKKIAITETDEGARIMDCNAEVKNFMI